eukprot:SAG11_NODE_8464_length_1012_cov_1.363636_2_plen_253_part_01
MQAYFDSATHPPYVGGRGHAKQPPPPPPPQSQQQPQPQQALGGGGASYGAGGPIPEGPIHGRRASQGYGRGQGGQGYQPSSHAQDHGHGARGLAAIEEERSIEAQLYQPLSPQHARYRLANADPEAQDAMLRKSREQEAMRANLAEQIAAKQVARQESDAERRRADAQEAMEEQRWNEQLKHASNYTPARGPPPPPQNAEPESPPHGYGCAAHWSDATTDLGADAVPLVGRVDLHRPRDLQSVQSEPPQPWRP